NSLAMYEIGRWPEGVLNATRLIGDGTSPLLAITGAVAALVLLIRGRDPAPTDPHSERAHENSGARTQPATFERPLLLLLLAPASLLALPFVALAAGNPGVYARFAISVDIVLAIVAAALLARLGRSARYTLPLLLATVIWC